MKKDGKETKKKKGNENWKQAQMEISKRDLGREKDSSKDLEVHILTTKNKTRVIRKTRTRNARRKQTTLENQSRPICNKNQSKPIQTYNERNKISSRIQTTKRSHEEMEMKLTMKIAKMTRKEKREHPWMSWKQAWRVARDHYQRRRQCRGN